MIQTAKPLGFLNPRWFKWQTYLDFQIQDDSTRKPTWIPKSKMIQAANLLGFLNPRWFNTQTYLDSQIQDDSSGKLYKKLENITAIEQELIGWKLDHQDLVLSEYFGNVSSKQLADLILS